MYIFTIMLSLIQKIFYRLETIFPLTKTHTASFLLISNERESKDFTVREQNFILRLILNWFWFFN